MPLSISLRLDYKIVIINFIKLRMIGFMDDLFSRLLKNGV